MSENTIVYGIKNCDSVKKARKWLESRDIAYTFHDFRADGLSKDLLQTWLNQLGAEAIINTRSTTWKQLSEKDQKLALGTQAAAVVLANPTLIKRPVLAKGDTLVVGPKLDVYEDLFA